eukprot:sb/3477610/
MGCWACSNVGAVFTVSTAPPNLLFGIPPSPSGSLELFCPLRSMRTPVFPASIFSLRPGPRLFLFCNRDYLSTQSVPPPKPVYPTLLVLQSGRPVTVDTGTALHICKV